jgi:hypothetical protein
MRYVGAPPIVTFSLLNTKWQAFGLPLKKNNNNNVDIIL